MYIIGLTPTLTPTPTHGDHRKLLQGGFEISRNIGCDPLDRGS